MENNNLRLLRKPNKSTKIKIQNIRQIYYSLKVPIYSVLISPLGISLITVFNIAIISPKRGQNNNKAD